MRCFVGIDLGSTTTKAVVLDEEERILGRGITNSRSNYDVACAVARSEAFINARFGLVEDALAGHLDEAGAWVDRLLRAYRVEQHAEHLDRLDEALRDEVAHRARGDDSPRDLPAVVEAIVDSMRRDAPALFRPGAPRRSDFFRDIAASEFLGHADRMAKEMHLPFDLLSGLFDKAILIVENQTGGIALGSHGARIVARALREAGRRDDDPAAAVLARAVHDAGAAELETVNSVGTGYGRRKLPFAKEQIRSEILCHGLGAHAMFPDTRTVLDIGGQDTKAIQVDEAGIVTGFQMNDRCAAGCGRYLGYIADEMNMGVHELGPLARRSCSPVRISSTCTVFAGAELRDRLTLGQRREDILAGLHRAIVLRAMSLLARSGGVSEEFTFTGGVAKNEAAVDALATLVAENYGERTLNISPDSIYTGSIGAALFALRDARSVAWTAA